MTAWQSHPTFRGLLTTGASEPYALDLAADWLMAEANLLPADLPAVLRWYAGEPPSWDTGEGAQRAGVLWRWLRLMEPAVTLTDKGVLPRELNGEFTPDIIRWQSVQRYNTPQLVSPLSVKRHTLALFPDVEAEVTFRGHFGTAILNDDETNGDVPHTSIITFNVPGRAQLLRFVVGPDRPSRCVRDAEGYDLLTVAAPAPQWIGEEDVRRARIDAEVQRITEPGTIYAQAAETLEVGDFVTLAPDGLARRCAPDLADGRILANTEAQRVGQIRLRPSFSFAPASPPAPPA